MRYSIYDGDSTRRYLLGSSGARPLLVLGCNPHKATEREADKTSEKVERIVEIYRRIEDAMTDGFALINVYPVRSKTVHLLPKDGCESTLLIESNLRKIETFARDLHPLTIWGAWGADLRERRYLRTTLSRIIAMLQPYNPRWLRFGELTPVTRDPRHPSRLGYKNSFSELHIWDYLDPNAA